MEFTHLLFWVADNTISDRFYKKLGFAIEFSDDNISVVEGHGLRLELVTWRDDEEFARDSMNGDKARGLYIYIQAGDVDEFYKRLQKLGIKAVQPPRNWPWGRREFVIKDPDGYKLCFYQVVNT
jgi:catechol 2,3-dioxygenase-like lactoylglutathione lyase family enzyme